jgi:hypothetical protein
VSRSHARVDWHGGSFQLTDLSYNGTYVRFADGEDRQPAPRQLHAARQRHDRPRRLAAATPASACVNFDVLRFGDTQPRGSRPLTLPDAELRACEPSPVRLLYVEDDRINALLLFEQSCAAGR